MKRIAVFVIIILGLSLFSQNTDLLYFCESYDTIKGEINCGDRFYKGELTVMAHLSSPIFYESVSLELDKYNPRANTFEYYQDYKFDVNPEQDYIYFQEINFGDPGIYRVFLLDPSNNNITSSLIEIIP